MVSELKKWGFLFTYFLSYVYYLEHFIKEECTSIKILITSQKSHGTFPRKLVILEIKGTSHPSYHSKYLLGTRQKRISNIYQLNHFNPYRGLLGERPMNKTSLFDESCNIFSSSDTNTWNCFKCGYWIKIKI